MKYLPTALNGVWIEELERHEDERGSCARAWCHQQFTERDQNRRLLS